MESKTPGTKKQRLACQRCRSKRRRCDGGNPCANCVRHGTECTVARFDGRSARYPSAYVENLEGRLQELERALSNTSPIPKPDNKKATTPKRISKAKYVALSPVGSNNSESTESHSSTSDTSPTIVVTEKPTGNAAIGLNAEISTSSAGATGSIYPTNSLLILRRSLADNNPAAISKTYQSPTLPNSVSKNTRTLPLATNKDTKTNGQLLIKRLSRKPLILQSLSLFFKWLYPGHFLFIHRETFLSAFFGDTMTKSYYCSQELVYSIAALGSQRASKKDELFHQSSSYYAEAKTLVLRKIFQLDDNTLDESTSSAKLAIIQTLLCLAFYDIGQADNPSAWYLSGLAFRIAHEIGLHLNPESWTNVYEDELSRMDLEVRSRIYWGCYIADHLISVIFGRSSTLKMSNSTVPETDELPEIESGIEEYMYNPHIILPTARPIKKLIILSRITEIFASKIFEQDQNRAARREYLLKFNTELINWRQDLSEELAWSRDSLSKLSDFNPTVAYVWLHFYVLAISYNKPFIDELDDSKNLVNGLIEEINTLLNVWLANFQTVEKSSIYMVYSAILAIQCMKSSNIDNKHYSNIMNYLKLPTLNYDLASKFVEITENENINSTAEPIDLLGSLTNNGTDFSLEYKFDLTLLNEIDTLIGDINIDTMLGTSTFS